MAYFSTTNNLFENDNNSPNQERDSNGSKRKPDNGGPPLQRTKRNRYITIACNECKRRKIKCNGQNKCVRCTNMDLPCIYESNCCTSFKDSREYSEMSERFVRLEGHVAGLHNDMQVFFAHHTSAAPMRQSPLPTGHTPQEQQAIIDPALQTASLTRHGQTECRPPRSPIASKLQHPLRRPSASSTGQAVYHGPTSTAFGHSVGISSVESMIPSDRNDDGEGGAGDVIDETFEPSPHGTPPSRQISRTLHPDKDPIWSISLDEAMRLLDVYQDEMGMMYPVLNIEATKVYAHQLFTVMASMDRAGLMQRGMRGPDAMDSPLTNVLKMVLAVAMISEEGGQTVLGQRLYDSARPAVDRLIFEGVDVEGMRLQLMTAMYEFHRDSEHLSWRFLGFAARGCLQLGLHRRQTYKSIKDPAERDEMMLLFWSIYVLDRRWSFGTGLPFALQDGDIDDKLEKPGEKSPYLNAMVEYSSIGSKVWRSVNSTSGTSMSLNIERMARLDQLILEWHRDVPPHLRFEKCNTFLPLTELPTRADNRLRILLYLRLNKMRMMIYRPVLHTATSIYQHGEVAQRVVDVAKDTIHVLKYIKKDTDLYESQQCLFNAFLNASVGVLFLVVAHAPGTFANSVRDDFITGTEIVRGMSGTSYVGQRLWKTIRSLQEVASKLGLNLETDVSDTRESQEAVKGEPDANHAAALTMTGLAGHNIDDTALHRDDQHAEPDAPGPWTIENAMANDLNTLFDAASGYPPMGSNGLNAGQGAQNGYYNAPNVIGEGGLDSMAQIYGGEGGLGKIFRDMF